MGILVNMSLVSRDCIDWKTHRNMAKNLAPMLVVTVQMIPPTTLTIIKQMICILRSFVLPDVHVTSSEIKKVAIHTGAVIKRVSTLPYPRVCTMVGKKYWKFWDSSETCCRRMKR